MTTEGDDSDNTDAEMAECGACRTVIPVDSTSCSSCGVSFTGVAEDDMGECGACGALVELGSKSCSQCGVHFVLDDLTTALTDWMKEEGITITNLFGKVDTDGDGSLTTDEIKQSLLGRSLAFLPHNDLDRFLAQIDLNSDGEISLGELAAALSMPFTAAKAPLVLEPVQEEAAEETESEDKPEEAEEESKAESDEEAPEEDADEDDEAEEEEAFLEHAMAFDEDGNHYLKKSELEKAAAAYETPAQAEPEVGDDAEEADEEEADDEAEEEESDAEETDDVDEGEDSDDGDDEAGDDDDDADEEDATDSAVDAFTRLIEAVEASSESARGLFEKLDRNESDNVDSDEFKDAVRELMDDDFSDEDLDSIISAMDTDDDGYLDIIEITSALEDPEKVIEEIEKPKREGPADWQRFLMIHYENVFPIIYTIGVLFIGLWIVNALGLLVDGTGGPVAYDGSDAHILGFDAETNTNLELKPGEIYDCDAKIQKSNCANSLTPFAGDASSMPAGFYWDGIMFMVLGLLGLGGIFYLQRQIKGLRAEHRREKSEDDEDEEEKSDSDDDEDEKSKDDEKSDSDDEESDDADDASEDDEDEEEESEEADDDDAGDDAEDDGGEGDGIEIGARVGVEDEDGDWFGVVTEFDEDEDAVVVKREDDDEEYLVEWDSLFLED